MDDLAERIAFFGGTVNAGVTSFSTLWAARFRMAALVSVDYKVAQCLRAAARFDALRNINLTVQGSARTIRTVFTSVHAAALMLDHHINAPGNVQPNLMAAIASVGSSPSFVSHPTAFERAAMTH